MSFYQLKLKLNSFQGAAKGHLTISYGTAQNMALDEKKVPQNPVVYHHVPL